MSLHQGNTIKEIADKIKDNEIKYRNIFETAGDAIFLIDPETTQIIDANSSACNIYGYTHEEILQLKNADLSAEPDKSDKALQQTKRFINIPERLHKRKDGTVFTVEITGSFIVQNGKRTALSVVHDFSARKKVEEALRESELRFREMTDFLPQVVYELDHKGRVIFLNKTGLKLFGITEKKINDGIYAHQFFIPEDWGKLANYFDVTIKYSSTSAIHREFTGLKKDGTTFPVMVCNAIIIKNNEVKGTRGILVDITERKKLEEELAKSNQLLKKHYSRTLEQVKTYAEELKLKETQLLKLQKDHLQSQFETLKNQLNPHFLFNSLNVLASLISVDPEMAENFTIQLSKIYRYVLEHKSEDLVPLKTELDFLESYTFLLNIRFAEKLHIKIDLPDQKLNLKIPPLAIQIILENAIKHNTLSVKSPLYIDIFIDDHSYLNVINNFQPREREIESTGLGLKNITDRYGYFTDKETVFGRVDNKFVAKIPLL